MIRPTLPVTSIFTLLFVLLTSSQNAAAQPVASVDVMFSTDGGATFSDVATVDEMENFLLRIYFDNSGD